MPEELPSHLIDLIYSALLKSFWRKTALLNFLRRHKISENFLASWQETETKRQFLARLLPKLEAHAKGPQTIRQMAASLTDQVRFPDLEGWEDTPQKLEAATASVSSLRQYLEPQARNKEETKEREETRKLARERMQQAITRRETLATLSSRLGPPSKRLGTQQAGYDFQDGFYDVVNFFEIIHRRPYVTSGRQIDGSLTIEGTTYLTELKFTVEQADAPSIDTFLAKVNDKADNTMGNYGLHVRLLQYRHPTGIRRKDPDYSHGLQPRLPRTRRDLGTPRGDSSPAPACLPGRPSLPAGKRFCPLTPVTPSRPTII